MSTFDPDNPKTIGDHIRKFLADRRLAKQIEADLSDQATIEADYARIVAALDARDAQFWTPSAHVPACPGPEPEPEAKA